jgi:hypothetical protein
VNRIVVDFVSWRDSLEIRQRFEALAPVLDER